MNKFKNLNLKIKNAFKIGNLHLKIVTFFFSALGFSNEYIGALETREKVYRYLKKKYKYVIDQYDPNYDKLEKLKKVNANTIWMCWWQGIEYAPDIVKKCVDSVYRYMNEYNIVIITKENYNEFVEFPTYIINKWEKGSLTNTTMSDLLRTELLIRYGGLWLDATVFLTGPIPEYIKECNIFMFKCIDEKNTKLSFNSWFIFSRENNGLLKTVRTLMYEYLKKEKHIRDYFIWHLIVSLILENKPEYLNGMYYVPDELAHLLSTCIFENYDSTQWNIIKNLITVNKLSTKFDISVRNGDSFYEKIIKGELI